MKTLLETIVSNATARSATARRRKSLRVFKKEAQVRRFRMEDGRMFGQFADAVPILIWTADERGVIDYASGAFLRYVDASRIDEGPIELADFIHPDDVGRAAAASSAAVAADRDHSVEVRIRRGSDGEYRWHQVNGAPLRDESGGVTHWCGTVTDIHGHKMNEEELQRVSDRLTSTLESITDAFYTVDKDWRITYLNAEFESWLERPRTDIIGHSIWQLFPHLVGTSIDQEFHRALGDQVSVQFVQYFPLVKRWVEVHAYPWSEGLSIYLQDVTERRALDEKTRQAQRLEAIGQLTGGIAHDFNNLLTVIIGTAELLAEGLTDEASRELAELTLTSAEKGAELTRRLLSFARQMPLEPRLTNVNKLILGMDGLLRRTLGEQIEIAIIQREELWTTLVDASQLESAILNLCINARDAMPGGGKLTIETSNAVLDSDAIKGDADIAPGEYVMIAVSDAGTGMPPEIIQRAFEPFFTTKGVGQGSGLGLSMVYGFIRQSNGHVKICSRPGEGTTVKLYLPRSSGKRLPDGETANVAAITSGSGRILVVEDEQLVRENVAVQLRRLGYEVVVAENGPMALKVLERDRDFALLFTDVVMPGGMSGRDLADAARLICPEMPILFTSGYTENAFVRNGRLQPGMHFLGKPYRRQELASKIRSVLGGKRPVRRK